MNIKDNKTEKSSNDFYTLLATGLKMKVVSSDKIVTVLKQSQPSRKKTYVTSEMITGWWIDTIDLVPCC